MLGLGWSEIFIIVVVALLVIGPDKLPEVIRGTAKVFRQLQRMAMDVRHSLDQALEESPPKPTTQGQVSSVRRESLACPQPQPDPQDSPPPEKPASPPQDRS